MWDCQRIFERFLRKFIIFGRKSGVFLILKRFSVFSLGFRIFCEDFRDLHDFSRFLGFLKIFRIFHESVRNFWGDLPLASTYCIRFITCELLKDLIILSSRGLAKPSSNIPFENGHLRIANLWIKFMDIDDHFHKPVRSLSLDLVV